MNTPLQEHHQETSTERLDREFRAAAAPLTGGLSPVGLSLALADWAWRLGVSPGKQLELSGLALQLARDKLRGEDLPPAGEAVDDPRFRHTDWAAWSFNVMRASFRNAKTWWREAAHLPGMTRHHAEMTDFFARQALGLLTPANWLPPSPVVLHANTKALGGPLLCGLGNWMEDISASPADVHAAERDAHFKVGRDVAATPSKVVFRNRNCQIATRPEHGTWVEPADYECSAPRHERSWWTAWQQWLAAHSSAKCAPRALLRGAALGKAPGEYVLKCYSH